LSGSYGSHTEMCCDNGSSKAQAEDGREARVVGAPRAPSHRQPAARDAAQPSFPGLDPHCTYKK